MTSFRVLWLLLPLALGVGGPAAAPTHPELQRELVARVPVDQQARNAVIEWTRSHGAFDEKRATEAQKSEWDKLTEAMIAADRENTGWLREVVARHGWPTVTMVGRDGAHAAWLLVQHADLVPKFQRECLDLMSKLPAAEISQKELAYLADRVLLAEGKKQRYGTQFHLVDGKPRPRPLENPEQVDARRAAIGLSPLAEYAKLIEQSYEPRK